MKPEELLKKANKGKKKTKTEQKDDIQSRGSALVKKNAPAKDAYEKYLSATKPVIARSEPKKTWRDEAIERLTPKALTPPTQTGQTYSEKLAENRATAQRLSKGVPETAEAPNNINELIFGKPVQAGTVNPRISAADISTRYNTMTDKEKAAYAYLKSKEAEEADQYLKAIEMDINKRNTDKLMADAKRMATERIVSTPVADAGGHANPTMAGFGYKNDAAAENAGMWYSRFMGNSLPANLAATAYTLYQGAKGEPVDPYHPLMAGQNIAQAQSEGFVGDAEGLARDIKMAIPSVFDFGTNLLTGGAAGLRGNALGNAVAGAFSAQAFAGASKDTAQRDGTGMQSVLTGTVAATLAYAIEKIGFDRLAEIGTLKNGRGVISTLVKSMFSEGAEEGAEEAGNILADVVIMGDKNDLVQLYNEARANGATFTDAFNKATAAGVDQVVESAKVGAIAGGMMGGGTAMVNHLVGGNVLENDVPDTNVGEPEQLNTTTEQVNRTTIQNDTAGHETAISDELVNSPAEMKTQPIEAQERRERASELPETERFLTENFYAEGRRVIGARLDATGNVDEMSGATAIYNAALAGRPYEEIRHKYASTARLDSVFAKEVYEAGLKDRGDDLTERMTGRGKFAKSKGVILDDVAVTEGQKALANLVSKVGGMTVRIVDTDSDYNGWYERSENEIVIALDSQHGFAPTLFHETVHFIRAANADGYLRLQDAVFQMAAKMKGKPVEAYMEEYKARWERKGGRYKYGDVMEEMTADAMMEIAADEKGMKELISLLRTDNPTVLEQIKEFIDKLLQTLESLVKDGRFNQWADAIHADIENTKKLRQIFAEELREAGRAARSHDGDILAEAKQEDGEIRYSIKETAFAAGLEAIKDPKTGRVSFEKNGKPVKKVTAEHIKNHSGFGALIKTALENGNITEQEAEKQYKAISEIMNMILKTQDPELVWAFAGSSLFSAVKTNSDPQYGTTIDFTTVCRKTQNMITAMSDAMTRLRRGLTVDEVTELQNDLVAEGSTVPCPVCYVFSRWAGVGNILDNMKRWQDKYENYSEAELQNRIEELTKKLDGKVADLRKMLKEQDERYDALNREKERDAYQKKKLKEERKKAVKEKDKQRIAEIDAAIKAIDDKAPEIKKELDRIKNSVAPELSWLLNVRTHPEYREKGHVPPAVLFDLNAADMFSSKYPLGWKYRSTRGPGAGKAILPYSDMRLGDMILGTKNNSANGNALFRNIEDGEFDKKQKEAIDKTVAKVNAQNLVGGQRFQSTSDFRYDYALDYLMAFMECQALGSKIQTYTKIIEFADMIASIGGDVNLSVMPKDKGYEVLEDGTKRLIYSNVTGIDAEAAKISNAQHDNVQLILVGINDEHIRLALEDSAETGGNHIGFVIPYHASGASINDFISKLVSNLGEKCDATNYEDYEKVQGDSEIKNATAKQKERRELRSKILKGKDGQKNWDRKPEEIESIKGVSKDISDMSFTELRAIEKKALAGNKDAIAEYESWSAGVLWDVYQKMWIEGGSEFGVRLSSSQAKNIMPHEYWNKTTSRDKAYINGFIFRSYCYSLGLKPRFTGEKVKGRTFGDFSESTGYWKTLIDRPMYNNDGTYRDQQKVNVTEFKKEMLTPDYAKENWGDYAVAEPDDVVARRATDKFVAEKQGAKFSVRESGLDNIEKKYADKTDYLFLHESGDTVFVDNMVVKKEYRDRGVGTQILEDITAYADREGMVIALTPTSEFGTKTKLTKWYKKHGFVENKGKNTDFRLRDTMYRLPGQIKFSVREDFYEDYDDLRAENEELKGLVESLRHQFEITGRELADPVSIRKVAKKWLKSIHSTYDVNEFAEKFQIITEFMANSQNEYDSNDAIDSLVVLARDAMEESEVLDDEMWNESKEMRSMIRGTRLKVTEETRAELEDMYGYSDFRRDAFGTMTLAHDKGTPIDVFYEELCMEHPKYFRIDDAMTQGEMLTNILEVVQSLRPVADNPYGYSLEEYAQDAAFELFDLLRDVKMQEPTFADKYEKKLADQKAYYQERLKAARDRARVSREKHESAFDAKYQRLKDRNKKNADRRKARVYRNRIEKIAHELKTWLEKPTDTKHVPEDLKKHTGYILDMIVTKKDSEKTNLKLLVSRLAAEYRQLDPDLESNKEMDGRYIEYDDNLTLIAKALEKSLAKKNNDMITLDDLTAAEMKDLKDMIEMLKKTLKEANLLLSLEKRAEVAAIGDDILSEMSLRKTAVQAEGKLRVLNDFFKLDMLDANSFFKRMSQTAHATIYRAFRKGLDKKIRYVREAAKFMNELVDKKTVKAWRNTAPEKFELTGGVVYLNIPQIMSVYCLSRREQGKQHLYTGGVVGDTRYKTKKLSKETLEAMRQVTGATLTAEDVNNITDRLTEEQKKVAREMQRFLSNRVAEWGNETTMLMYGYKKFNEVNYFPITVDGDTVLVSVGKPKDATKSLRSLGMTKALDEHAQNPVMAMDIFEVFAKHVDQMSSYAAFVPAISDTNKILNYKVNNEQSVRKAMKRVMGGGGITYIHKLVDMINGAVSYSNDGAFAKAMVRNMKIASVGFNARVVVQQPTALLRALSIIDVDSLMTAGLPTKEDWDKIYEYAPIAWWKEQGYYDVNIGRSIETLMTGSSGKDAITDAAMWGAGKADKFTWGILWKACEKQIRKEQPKLTGEDFYEAVGELFSRTIDETQVVDSPLHRSQKMREKGLFPQMSTSFMSEPMKTYNMAATALMNLMREDTAENRKQFARSLWWLAFSATATAAAAAVVDAGRDDDDDEKWADKWKEAFLGDYSEADGAKDLMTAFFASNLGANVNPISYLPYMRDLVSIMSGYDVKRTDMDWAVDIKNAIIRLNKYEEGESEYTATAVIAYAVGAFSKVTGVPLRSLMRDMEAMENWIRIHVIGTEEAKYENSKQKLDIGSTKNIGHYTERYFRAYNNGDKALAKKIYNEMVAHGISKEDLDSRIKKNVNQMMFDAHVSGNTSEFRKHWNDQKGRGEEDSSLRTSLRNKYETMYKNAVESGDKEQMRKAKSGFMEFGGKEKTLEKYH